MGKAFDTQWSEKEIKSVRAALANFVKSIQEYIQDASLPSEKQKEGKRQIEIAQSASKKFSAHDHAFTVEELQITYACLLRFRDAVAAALAKPDMKEAFRTEALDFEADADSALIKLKKLFAQFGIDISALK